MTGCANIQHLHGVSKDDRETRERERDHAVGQSARGGGEAEDRPRPDCPPRRPVSRDGTIVAKIMTTTLYIYIIQYCSVR